MDTFFLIKPQTRHYLLKANKIKVIAGRATGKSKGFVAPRVLQICDVMPSTSIGFCAKSFTDLLTKIIPGVKAGLYALGWKENRDYFCGTYAPHSWGWERPQKHPDDPKYLFHMRTGNVLALISQNMPGSANGYDLAATICDEAKFLNKTQYDEEVVPAMRGDHMKYGNLWSYRSEAFFSDMPTSESAMWLIDEPSASEKEINDVIMLQILLDNMIDSQSDYNDLTWQKKILPEIHAIERLLNQRRRRMNCLLTASSLDNIQNIGEDYIIDLDRKLSPFVFRTSVLNHRLLEKEKNFYPALSDVRHGKPAVASQALLDIGYSYDKISEHTSMYDGDVNMDLPLHIAGDYGVNFNCIVTGQIQGQHPRYVKNIHRDHPLKIQDVAWAWKQYYRHHKRKEVFYYYDATADFESPISNLKYWKVVHDILRDDKYGSWDVKAIHIGTNRHYDYRQALWTKILTDQIPELIGFQYNQANCNEWYESCKLTGFTEVNGKLMKDKRSERLRHKGYATQQHRATHYSEAGDVLIIGMVEHQTSVKRKHYSVTT